MNERLFGRWRGAYSLVVVPLLFAISLPALAWTGLLSTTDQPGEKPVDAMDRGAPKQIVDRPAVVEGAFRAKASVVKERAEDRAAREGGRRTQGARRGCIGQGRR